MRKDNHHSKVSESATSYTAIYQKSAKQQIYEKAKNLEASCHNSFLLLNENGFQKTE